MLTKKFGIDASPKTKEWGGTLRHSPHPMPMALSLRSEVAPQHCLLSYDATKISIFSIVCNTE